MKIWLFFIVILLSGCASEPVKVAARTDNFAPDRIVILAPQKEIYVHQYDTSSTNPLAMASLHLPGLFVFGVIAATTQSSIKPSERVYERGMVDLKSIAEITNLSDLIAAELVDTFKLSPDMPIDVFTSKEKVTNALNNQEKVLVVKLSFLLTENFKSPIIFSELSYEKGSEDNREVFYQNQIELTGNDLSALVSTERMTHEYKNALYKEYEILASEFADVFQMDLADLENPKDYSSFSHKRFVSPIPNSMLIAEKGDKQIIRYLGYGRRGAICSLPLNSNRSDGFCRRHTLVEN